VHRDDDLALYRVGGDQPPAAHRGLLIGAHLVWFATLLGGVAGSVRATMSVGKKPGQPAPKGR
jgi:hypothetical protein